MMDFRILAGDYTFKTVYCEDMAPETVVAFKKHLPDLRSGIAHTRWSGQTGQVPFEDLGLDIGHENRTCYPLPGEIVIYPGGKSETELLVGYGYVNFASKVGQLPGGHFATIVGDNEGLKALGEKFLWEGVQDIELRPL